MFVNLLVDFYVEVGVMGIMNTVAIKVNKNSNIGTQEDHKEDAELDTRYNQLL